MTINWATKRPYYILSRKSSTKPDKLKTLDHWIFWTLYDCYSLKRWNHCLYAWSHFCLPKPHDLYILPTHNHNVIGYTFKKLFIGYGSIFWDKKILWKALLSSKLLKSLKWHETCTSDFRRVLIINRSSCDRKKTLPLFPGDDNSLSASLPQMEII